MKQSSQTWDKTVTKECPKGTVPVAGKLRHMTAKGTPARFGLSLLEILISIFVLSIGLLGVAAVIPLGHHSIMESTKADRAGACGRAGLHEVKTRGWINLAVWRQLSVNETDPISALPVPPDLPPPYTQPVTKKSGIRRRDSFAIDPLFFVHQSLSASNTAYDSTVDHDNSYNPMIWRFPLDATAATIDTPWRRSSLVRVTFWQDDSSVLPPWPPLPSQPVYRMPFAAANRVFTWRDDMLFPLPEEADDRPRQMVMWDNSQGLAYPRRDADGIPVAANDLTPAVPQADDNYSWMATVTPIFDGLGHDFWEPDVWDGSVMPISHTYVSSIHSYTVSIVVFYKRDFECPVYPFDSTNSIPFDPENPPKERSVGAQFPGDGFGGGDVLLWIDPSTTPENWLDVKKKDWLMLRGSELADITAPTSSGVFSQPRTVAKWYQVVAADSEIEDCTLYDGSAGRGRYVTLSGPDWQVDTDGDGQFEPMVDLPHTDGNTTYDWAMATLVDNVIGVYTTTVKAESDSIWKQ